MSDEALVRTALHAAFGDAVDPGALARGEAAIRAAAASPVPEAHGTPATDSAASVHPLPRRSSSWKPVGRAAALALVAVLAIGTPGVAAAAGRAAPGDGLYDAKLLMERVWTIAAPGDAATARVHLRLAVRRLDEVDALAPSLGDAVRQSLLLAAATHLGHAERLDADGLLREIRAVRARLAAARTTGAADAPAAPTGRASSVPDATGPEPTVRPALPPPTGVDPGAGAAGPGRTPRSEPTAPGGASSARPGPSPAPAAAPAPQPTNPAASAAPPAAPSPAPLAQPTPRASDGGGATDDGGDAPSGVAVPDDDGDVDDGAVDDAEDVDDDDDDDDDVDDDDDDDVDDEG
jgi:hypothetical protein